MNEAEVLAFYLDHVADIFGDAKLATELSQLPVMGLQALVRPFLVHPHQTRVADHIGGKDRGQTAGRGHGSGSPPKSTRG